VCCSANGDQFWPDHLLDVVLFEAFHDKQLTAAAPIAIPSPAKANLVSRDCRVRVDGSPRTCSGRTPIPTAYPTAR
ncbi:MAG: hypothetical protein ABSF53_24780, partial [Terracidiphilus sp.]